MKIDYNTSNTVFEKQLKSLFRPLKENDQSDLFKVIGLVLGHSKPTKDLNDVYNLLGLDSFTQLVTLLDGRIVRFPTSVEFQEAITLALCFYYREIEKKEWPEIKQLVPYNFLSKSMAYKIKSLNKALQKDIVDIVRR